MIVADIERRISVSSRGGHIRVPFLREGSLNAGSAESSSPLSRFAHVNASSPTNAILGHATPPLCNRKKDETHRRTRL